jgi:small subunit ribosomal protein S18
MAEEQTNTQVEETQPAETQAAPEASSTPPVATAAPVRPADRAVQVDDEEEEAFQAGVGEDEEIPPADDTVEEEEEEEEEFDETGPSEFRPKAPEQRQGFRGRNRHRIGSDVRIENIDYKNVELLMRFIDNRGRILSRRKTRVSAKMQRRVTQAIKRARYLALLPFTAEHVRLYRKR